MMAEVVLGHCRDLGWSHGGTGEVEGCKTTLDIVSLVVGERWCLGFRKSLC